MTEMFSAVSEPLVYLSYIASILLIGILASLLAKKIKVPNILFLLLLGIILGNVKYNGNALISFPDVFIIATSIIALVMIVFDSSSQFKIKEFDTIALRVSKLSFLFLILVSMFLSFATMKLFDVSIWNALIFATLMSGTDPDAVLSMFAKTKVKVLEILEVESIINTPFTVILPFIVLEVSNKLGDIGVSKLDIIIAEIQPIIVLVFVGVGTGVVMGLIGSKIMKHHYIQNISQLAVITFALLTYILSEHLGGNGVLAVAILGLFFGNFYIKEKMKLMQFSDVLASLLEIIVFILIGMIINFPLTLDFAYKSLLLFLIYVIIRFLAVTLSFKAQQITFKERIFMTINVQKGTSVAVVALFLSAITGLTTILHLTLAFILYSIVLSTVSIFFRKSFLLSKGV